MKSFLQTGMWNRIFFTNHPKMAYPDHRFVYKMVSVLKTWMFLVLHSKAKVADVGSTEKLGDFKFLSPIHE